MPVIFSSSLLALPTALARYANSRPVEAFAAALNPSGPFYLPVSALQYMHRRSAVLMTYGVVAVVLTLYLIRLSGKAAPHML